MPQMQTVTFDVAVGDRTEVARLIDFHAPQVRAREGCLDYRAYVDASGAVLLLQMWEDQTVFEDYRSGDEFRALNLVLKPLMIAAPVSRTYDIVPRQKERDGA